MDENFRELEWLLDEAIPWRAIPPEFYSAYSGEPFCQCVDCENPLSAKFYEIEKIYRGQEVIFEYALCTDCGAELLKQYSKESQRALRRFFLENYLPSLDLGHCHFCQQEQNFQGEFAQMALCRGSQLASVMILCIACMEKLAAGISEQTRKAMGDFITNKFPGIPAEFEFVSLLKL